MSKPEAVSVEALPYLNGRHYVHGTSIFRWMSSQIGSPAKVRFHIPNRVVNNKLEMQRSEQVSEEWDSWLQVESSSRRFYLGIIQVGRVSQLSSIYDETTVLAQAEEHGDGLQVHQSELPVLDTAVPLLKRLLGPYQGTGIAGRGQWFMTAYHTFLPQAQPGRVFVVVDRGKGRRFVRGKVISDGVESQLYFAWA